MKTLVKDANVKKESSSDSESVKRTRKKVFKTDYLGYKVNQKVDVHYMKDGIGYWINGYSVFDPSKEIDTAKGLTVRTLKKCVASKLEDHIPVVSGDGTGRAIAIHKDRIRLHKKEDSYSFEDVFGSITTGGIVLKDVRFDDEKDDLTLGIDVIPSEMEED